MIFLNQFSLVTAVTAVTLVTPYSGAACTVTSSFFVTGDTGDRLTLQRLGNILGSLSEQLEGGLRNLFTLGFNKPLFNVVFLRPQKIKAVLIRLLSMVGCIGQPLWLVVPKGDIANPIQSATRCFATNGSGLKPQSLGHTAMNTQTSSATAPQNHTQDLTQLNKAFLKLCSSIGIANNKAPENLTSGNFDMIATDTDELLQIANALFSQKLTADRAFKQAPFDAVPMENKQT